jgi:AbrB family looped-hinge helix DNA binding protein
VNPTSQVKAGQTITVGPKGQAVIPVEYRRALGIEAGDELIATLENDQVVLITRKALAKRLRGSLKTNDGRNLTQELLEDRRSETKRKGF